MSTKILIVGGTGFIGRHLTQYLVRLGYDVSLLSRNPPPSSDVPIYRWSVEQNHIDEEALDAAYIINLAGAGIADKRWTEKRKERIISSRVDSLNVLYEKFKDSSQLKAILSTSAIGYYGADRGDEQLDEESDPTDHFISQVVQKWENAVTRFATNGIRTVIVRTGIVLGRRGALPRLVRPVQLGIGSPIGSGNQFMSWIHADDLCGIFEMALRSNNFKGIYNGVAPNAVSNKEMTQTIGRVLNRPVFMPNVPGIMLRILFGEMADILLGGLNVRSQKVQDAGYEFKFVTAEAAIRSIYSG